MWLSGRTVSALLVGGCLALGAASAAGAGGPRGGATGAIDAVHAAAAVHAGQGVDALVEEIAELRQEATRASQAHERLRREAAAKREHVGRLRDRLRRERHRLAKLRDVVGAQARRQYQAGGSMGLARLMLADSPQAFLDAALRIDRGELAARRLLESVRRSEARLARNGQAAAEELRELRERVRAQREIQGDVESTLSLAERKLRELRAARRAARGLRAAGGVPGGVPGGVSGDASGCPVAVRDDTKDVAPTRSAGAGAWVAPVRDAVLTAGFGRSGDRWSSLHTGQDFAVPQGTPVRAIGSGTVETTGCGDAFGNSVVVAHDNGYYSQYAHLSLIEVAAGQRVSAGQRIGRAGSTGNSTGPHLHLEIRLTPYLGSGIDPIPWLRDHGVVF